jgi:hypothetical protein
MRSELFDALPFLESGWEYATEMIISARNLDARIDEVPINFYKEPKGRVSHHRRSSWLSPFRAGWGTLRVTATYLIDRLFVIPGIIIMSLSTTFNLLSTLFPKFFSHILHVGVLSQSLMMFASGVGAFLFNIWFVSKICLP